MSRAKNNFYPHLDNCLPDICAAGCKNRIFQHGWEVHEKADAEQARLTRDTQRETEITNFEVWQRTAKQDAIIDALINWPGWATAR